MHLALITLLSACTPDKADTAPPVWPTPPTTCDDAIRVPIDGGPTVGDAGAADPSTADLGEHPDPTQIYLGFSHDPQTSAGFTWQTDTDTRISQVEIRTGEYAPVVLDGASFVMTDDDDSSVRVHEAHLCDLEPATTYTIRLGGEGAWSEPRDITTAPADGHVRIAIIGDNNLGYPEWGKLVQQIITHEPDLVVHTGDVLHDGHSQAEWASWFEYADGLVGTVPMVVSHGNHEERAALYFAHIVQPDNETWFGFDWGPAHFVILDSEQSDSIRTGEEATLLDTQLGDTDRPWTFAAFHRPPYASGEDTDGDGSAGGDESIRAAWGPIFDAHHADVVFNGHWHYYERTVPIYAEAQAASPADGTTYVITGGGGALPTQCGDAWFSAVCETAFHFVIMELDQGHMTLTAYRDDGTVLDTLEVDQSTR